MPEQDDSQQDDSQQDDAQLQTESGAEPESQSLAESDYGDDSLREAMEQTSEEPARRVDPGTTGIPEIEFEGGDDGGLGEPEFPEEGMPEDEEDDMQEAWDRIESRQSENEQEESGDVSSSADADEETGETGEEDQPPEGEQDQEEGEGPSFNQDLLKRAESFGISEDEAKQYGSPDVLRMALEKMEDISEPASEGFDLGDEDQDISDKSTQDILDQMDIDIDLGGLYDPEIVESFDKVVDGLKTQAQQMAEFQSSMQEELIRRDIQDMEREFDSYLQTMDDSYAEYIGDGPIQSLDGDVRETREKVLDKAWEEIDSHLQKDEPVPPTGELLQSALGAVLGDKVNDVARDQVRKEVQARNQQSIGRPSGRETSSGKSGKQKAIERVRKMRENRASQTTPSTL